MTTQVPALSAMTLGQASDSSVRRIGPSSSAFLTGGWRRRQRTLVLVDGNFGDADIGHFCSRARRVTGDRAPIQFLGAYFGRAMPFPSTAMADSACAGRNGGLRD